MDNVQKFEVGLLILILIVAIVFSLYSFGITGFIISEDSYYPHDFINNSYILNDNGRLTLNISNYSLVRFEGTGSMEPVFGEDSTGVGIRPQVLEDVHIGDIVTFKKNGIVIAHRVVDIGEDEEGIYFIVKGDRNDFDDGKIRFSDIELVIVAIIY